MEVLYPDRRKQSWVNSPRWWVANWVGLLLLYAVGEWLTQYDPGLWKIAFAFVILALGFLARWLPGSLRQRAGKVAHPCWLCWLCFLGVLGHTLIVHRNADTGQLPFQVTMVILAFFDLGIAGSIWWITGHGVAFDDRRRITLISGALVFFLIFGPLTVGNRYPVLYFTSHVFLCGLWWLARKIDRRQALQNLVRSEISISKQPKSQPMTLARAQEF